MTRPVTQPEDLERSFTVDLELRASEGGDGRTLLGRAIPYGEVADIGGRYSERFVMGAFARQIASGTHGRVKLFASHQARITGAAPIGKTIRLEERTDGLHGAWPLFDTTPAEDALKLVRAGEVMGLSVGFKAIESKKAADGVLERLVVHLDHVILTHEPAYEMAGVTGLRATAKPLAVWKLDLERSRRLVLPS